MPSGPDVAVFICYRVSDSADDAGRLHRLLSERLDPTRVRLGIDAVAQDDGFGEAVADTIGQADVVLMVIGPDWLTADAAGRRLLDDRADPVRLEIEAALARDIPIIPTLVRDAHAPRPAELPAPLQPLIRRTAFELHGDTFSADVERLLAVLNALGNSKAAEAAESRTGRRHGRRAGERERAAAAKQPSVNGLPLPPRPPRPRRKVRRRQPRGIGHSMLTRTSSSRSIDRERFSLGGGPRCLRLPTSRSVAWTVTRTSRIPSRRYSARRRRCSGRMSTTTST